MTSLADEIAAAAPIIVESYCDAPTVDDVAAWFKVGRQFVRGALDALRADDRVVVFRYPKTKAVRIAPAGFLLKQRACKTCDVLFERARNSKRQCCSRACSIKWSWTRPGVAEKRAKGIRAQKATPEGKAFHAEHNAKRWSNPEQRQRLSEWNKAQWADPLIRAQKSAAIQKRNGSVEKRRQFGEQRRAAWTDPDIRQKMQESAAAAHRTPESRAKKSEAMRRRWQDPEQRAKFVAANRARNDRKRGVKQSPEHVAKRVAAVKKAKASKKNQPASPAQSDPL